MSERVLTGPLLDLGTSFWSSSLVETEFPGLRGSRFHPSGRYGIGFYAVFMIADVVQVTSKRFDEGSDRGRRLVFRDGLSARPLLLKGLPPRFNTQFQTQVTLRIRPEAAEDVRRALLEWRTIVGGKTKTHSISLADRVAMMAPSVDCDIFVEEYGKARTCAHYANWHTQEPMEWLRLLTRSDLREDEQLDQSLGEAAPRLKTIEFAGRVVSRAALLDDSEDAQKRRGKGSFGFGIITHGGLASGGAGDEWPDGLTFVGVMEAEPATATRFQRPLRSTRLLADPRSLSDWVSFLKKFLPTEAENDVAILRYFSNFGRLGHLPPSHFILRRFDLPAYPQSMEELRLVSYEALLLAGQEPLELKFLIFEGAIVFFVYYDEEEVKSLIDLMQAVKIDSLHFSPIRGDEVNRIPKPSPQPGEPLCLLSVLRELFQSKGFTVEIEVEKFGSNVSPPFFTDGILTFRARLLKAR
jgi:hypothetical protein